MSASLTTQPPESTQYQRVVSRIRADILGGHWRADARLKVRDLAAQYGVSAAPIREGLQQLQGEGLVVMEPQRGARVRRVDEQLIVNIFDVREALESFLAARFAATASPHLVSMLDDVQAEHDAAIDALDYATAFEVNGRFHRMINGGARNPEAMDIIDRHLRLIRALRMECGFTAQRMRTIRAEHHRLIAAMRRNDAAGAALAAALHVRSSRDDLLSRLGPRLARQ